MLVLYFRCCPGCRQGRLLGSTRMLRQLLEQCISSLVVDIHSSHLVIELILNCLSGSARRGAILRQLLASDKAWSVLARRPLVMCLPPTHVCASDGRHDDHGLVMGPLFTPWFPENGRVDPRACRSLARFDANPCSGPKPPILTGPRSGMKRPRLTPDSCPKEGLVWKRARTPQMRALTPGTLNSMIKSGIPWASGARTGSIPETDRNSHETVRNSLHCAAMHMAAQFMPPGPLTVVAD
jgi:hypothetical protein